MSEAGPQGQPDEALVDLLIKQATEGLSPAEQRALDAFDSPSVTAELQAFERAAAAVSLAGIAPLQAPPAALRATLESQGLNFVAAAGRGAAGVADLAATRQFAAPRSPRAGRGAAAGWMAAAACLVLALFGWLRTPPPVAVPVAAVPVIVAPPVVEPPTAAQERTALLAMATTLKITLGATKDPAAAGVTGDVVWDPATQKGFLHFAGLAANDPAVRQYQIWIFDGDRDPRYPIDGGVFDVPANSADVVIPIHATLAVRKAAAFAVTVEKPGGVVVSGLQHVVVLGKAG